MKHLADATIKKAETLFNEYGSIITGHGLTRKELRQLEREGLIEKRLMKNKDTGSLIYEWRPVSVTAGLIAKNIKIT